VISREKGISLMLEISHQDQNNKLLYKLRRKFILWSILFLFLGIGLGSSLTMGWLIYTGSSIVPSRSMSSSDKLAELAPSVLPSPAPKSLDPKSEQHQGESSILEAVLLNGGGNAESNYFSHHLHIRMMRELLEKRGIDNSSILVFSTDGEDPKPDQVISTSLPWFWLWEDLAEARFIDPTRLINTTLPGTKMYPARLNYIRHKLGQLTQRVNRRTDPSTILLFVTDHGTRGSGDLNNKIELWHQQINVRQLRELLRPIAQKNRVISIMSQCYSGGFANLMYESEHKLHGNRCGFFSTIANREAYGCFPQTAKKGWVGHAYRMIRALRQNKTYDQAHREVLLTDLTPDVPISTSDIYLEHFLQRKFGKRREAFTKAVDRLLHSVWQHKPAFLNDEIALLRRIESHFYLSKHLSLQKFLRNLNQLREQIKDLQKFNSLWEKVWQEAQRGSLMKFYQGHPKISASVEREFDRQKLDKQSRKVGKQIYNLYVSHLNKHPSIKNRLKQLYKRYDRVYQQIYLLQVREGILLRVAMRLNRIAGLYYLHTQGSPSERDEFEKLRRCEETPIGGSDIKGDLLAEGTDREQPPDKIPTISLDRVFPSWLGIGFQSTINGWFPHYEKIAPGAVQITSIEKGSPADEGGLQIGDIILAVGGQMLQLSSELRELVMLAKPDNDHYLLIYRAGKMLTIKVHLKPLALLYSFDQNTTPEPDTHSIPPLPNTEIEPDTEVFGLPVPQITQPPTRKQSPELDIKLRSIDGHSLQFPAVQGISLVYFWATWCEACKALAPMLRKLQAKFSKKELQIFAVTSDTPALLKPFVKQWSGRFPFLIGIDKQGALSRRYRIDTIPQAMLFRPDGSVVQHLRIIHSGSGPKLASDIRQFLKP
jgi:thiol-disulfide isomerase/thioredoxin